MFRENLCSAVVYNLSEEELRDNDFLKEVEAIVQKAIFMNSRLDVKERVNRDTTDFSFPRCVSTAGSRPVIHLFFGYDLKYADHFLERELQATLAEIGPFAGRNPTVRVFRGAI